MSDIQHYTVLQIPKPVGGWEMPGSSVSCKTVFTAAKKPRWLTRKLMWHLLEWKWIDY